ncbi:MAG: folate-binding protein [Pseudomonadota bacterium]|nr:folate-binding protein [Pseudomonadota bacterium]
MAQFCPLTGRGVIAVSGGDAQVFLQGLISNDMAKVAGGQAIYAALLTAQGKFLFDFFVVPWGDGVLLDCEGERRADLLKKLKMYKLRSAVDVTDETEVFAVTALFGDGLEALLAPAAAAAPWGAGVIFHDPRDPAMGARLLHPRQPAPDFGALAAADPTAYEARRVALALPDGARDIAVEKDGLLDVGFERLNGVDFAKGCYMGQEVTARMKYRGLVKKTLAPLTCDGPPPAPGSAVMAGAVEVGQIRSGVDGAALALLRQDRLAAAADAGTPLIADGKPVSAA